MKTQISLFLSLACLVLFTNANALANKSNEKNKSVGAFEAEGKKVTTRFVRVLFAAKGSENEGESNDIEQLTYDSTDPKGNPVKVLRFQIVTKNTGYDEIQTSQEEDYKLKSVKEGAKIHIEVPLVKGKPQYKKAYVGSLAYNFGTRETRNLLKAETVSDIKLKISKLDLPKFGKESKPGDKGIRYNEGYIKFDLSCKAKNINSDEWSPFEVSVDGPISITHIRGQERQDRAVNIEPGIVKKNI